jgi:predicted amidohydrolase
MFRQIGFFHSTRGHAAPVGALKDELAKVYASHSLPVLPEAFNLGRQYRESGPCLYNRDAMIARLQEIAALSHITFVAGLLDAPTSDGLLPYSSAYVIDANGYRCICHKEQADGQEGKHCRRCSTGCS